MACTAIKVFIAEQADWDLRCLLLMMIDDTNSDHEGIGYCKLFIDEIASVTRDLV